MVGLRDKIMIRAILLLAACFALQACSSNSTSTSSDGDNTVELTPTSVDPAVTSNNTESTSILERRWNLVLYTGLDGNESELIPSTARVFETRGDELIGSVNCNNSNSGTYQQNENSIILTFGPATEIDCGFEGDQFRDQERSLDDLFRGQGEDNTDSRELMIDLMGDTLTLTAADGRRLVFREIL